MKIILENVIKGITVTGVAKIQNDKGEGKLKAKIIDQTEYDALVSNYKNLANSKKDKK